MVWYAWAIVIWLVVQGGYAIVITGKPRKPRTPLETLDAVVECGLVAWGVVVLAT